MLIGHSVSDADGVLLTMDRALSDLLHRSPREIVGMAYTELTHPADRAANVRQVESLDVGAPTLSLRKRYLRPGDTPVLCEVHVSRFAESGGRLVGTIHTVAPDDDIATPARLLAAALQLEDAMRVRRAVIGADLFADHAWFLLLEIWLAEARGTIVRPGALAERVGTTEKVTRRWLHVLVDRRFVDQDRDHDGAVQLTTAGIIRVEQMLALQAETRA